MTHALNEREETIPRFEMGILRMIVSFIQYLLYLYKTSPHNLDITKFRKNQYDDFRISVFNENHGAWMTSDWILENQLPKHQMVGFRKVNVVIRVFDCLVQPVYI